MLMVIGKLFTGVNDAGVSLLPRINNCVFFDTGDYDLSRILIHSLTLAINLSPVTTTPNVLEKFNLVSVHWPLTPVRNLTFEYIREIP
jgi:hypothetical protein